MSGSANAAGLASGSAGGKRPLQVTTATCVACRQSKVKCDLGEQQEPGQSCSRCQRLELFCLACGPSKRGRPSVKRDKARLGEHSRALLLIPPGGAVAPAALPRVVLPRAPAAQRKPEVVIMEGLFEALRTVEPGPELSQWLRPLVRDWSVMARRGNSYGLMSISLAISQRVGLQVDYTVSANRPTVGRGPVSGLSDYPREIVACFSGSGFAWARAITPTGFHLCCNAAFDARLYPQARLTPGLAHREGTRLFLHEDDEELYLQTTGMAWAGCGAMSVHGMREATAARPVRIFDRVAQGWVACRLTAYICVDREDTLWIAALMDPIEPAMAHDGSSELPLNAQLGAAAPAQPALQFVSAPQASLAQQATAPEQAPVASAGLRRSDPLEAAMEVAEVALKAAIAAAKLAEATAGGAAACGSERPMQRVVRLVQAAVLQAGGAETRPRQPTQLQAKPLSPSTDPTITPPSEPCELSSEAPRELSSKAPRERSSEPLFASVCTLVEGRANRQNDAQRWIDDVLDAIGQM